MPVPRKELSTKQVKHSDLWYLIGLITSDGSLSTDGRHIDITSRDYKFLKGVKDLIGLRGSVTVKYGGKNQKAFHIQISNKNFYDFLLSIGLMPKKSLTLRQVKVPDESFKDFLRGVIDGDGSIRKWAHPSNKGEQWSLRIYSGSASFSEWLFDKIKQILKAKGKLHTARKGPSKQFIVYTLKYGKMAARSILAQCYYPQAICLQRKNRLAQECIMSYKGWKTSKTVL